MRAAPSPSELERWTRDGLLRAEREVALAATMLLAYGLDELDAIALPPVSGSTDDARVLRELAPLYFVAELDRAGLLIAAERIAALVHLGEIHGDLRAAEAALSALWARRNRRFSPEERAAIFRRTFGGPGPSLPAGDGNAEFEPLLGRLADALLGHQDPGRPWGIADRSRLRTAAMQLVSSVSQHSTGVPRLASRELVEQVRISLAVVSDPGVQRAVGQRTAWEVVQAVTRDDALGPPDLHVQRARAGAELLSWLADQMPDLDVAQAPPERIVGAAFAWLEATLAEVRA